MNKRFGKIENGVFSFAPDRFEDPNGATVVNPSDGEYARRGYKRVRVAVPAEPPATGTHWEPDGWRDDGGEIVRTWREAANPPAAPRKFSKLKIYGTLASLDQVRGTANGATWDAVKAWLEDKDIGGVNGWMAFQLAQEVSEDHALFAPLAAEAKQLLGLTDAQLDQFLNACILEA